MRSNSAHSKLPSSSPSSAPFSADPTAASSSSLRSLNPDRGGGGGFVSAAPIPPTSSLPFHGQLLWSEEKRGKVALEAAAQDDRRTDRPTESEQTLLIRTISPPRSRKRKLLPFLASHGSPSKAVSTHFVCEVACSKKTDSHIFLRQPDCSDK